MSSKSCIFFGELVSFHNNDAGEQIFLVEEKSGTREKRKWSALPKNFEINLSKFQNQSFGLANNFTQSIYKPLIGKLVAFSVDINFYDNGRISGFDIKKLLSLDIETDINKLLDDIAKTKKAISTEIPIFEYLGYIGHYINGTQVKINDIEYEMAFIEKNYNWSYVSKYISADSLKKPSFYSCGNFGETLISIKEDYKTHLTISNISLIFDKFYRPIRGLGFNFEYSYGEAVQYHISREGDIVHSLHIDKVKYTEDTSSDRSSCKETTVLRLGDRLTGEMIDFLKEPVKGHYKPVVLFKK